MIDDTQKREQKSYKALEKLKISPITRILLGFPSALFAAGLYQSNHPAQIIFHMLTVDILFLKSSGSIYSEKYEKNSNSITINHILYPGYIGLSLSKRF